jgi:hypothetical protein
LWYKETPEKLAESLVARLPAVHPFSCGIADANADTQPDKHANDQRHRSGPGVPAPLLLWPEASKEGDIESAGTGSVLIAISAS